MQLIKVNKYNIEIYALLKKQLKLEKRRYLTPFDCFLIKQSSFEYHRYIPRVYQVMSELHIP